MRFPALALLSLFLIARADAETTIPPPREVLAAHLRTGIAWLDAQYWSPTLSIWLDRPGDDLRAHYERRRNPPWWPSAIAVEMLIDAMAATGTRDYDAKIGTLYDLQKDVRARRTRLVAELQRRNQWGEPDEQAWQTELAKPSAVPATGYYSDFQNEYLDDSGWWAITWLKMHDHTGAAKYLATAKVIHAHMAANWKAERGGGVIWCEDTDKQRPNTITNNLFLILSARLYRRTGEEAYLAWAEKTLAWMGSQSLYDGTALVDGPGHRGDYWSYNQGTYLGGLVAIYEATGDAGHLAEAAKVAHTVISRSGLVSAEGVLLEILGIKGDASLFKGVCARYLAQTREALESSQRHPEAAQLIGRCLRQSAAALLAHARRPDGSFAASWHEPGLPGQADFNTQVSALAALVAALASLP